MRIHRKTLPATLAFLLTLCLAHSQTDISGDWVSTKTLSSVVKLHSLLMYCVVDGLPDDYSFRMKGGEPDFGNARIVEQQVTMAGVGTGVVVTEDGLIMSNAHVTRAYLDPEIAVVTGAGGAPKIGSSGKPLKSVLYNMFPYYMFVGLTTQEEFDAGDDVQKPRYAAMILDDDEDYGRRSRDRALLKVVYPILEMKNNLPVIGDYVGNNVKLSFSEMANPFKTSLLDKKVRAIGFPGSGDPKRSSRTAGELLGYEGDKYSVLLHTSWISNGNSGGGLFYKDKLIGINTWDNRNTSSRPVGEAQPITYWAEMFAKYEGIFNMRGPAFDYAWINDDPGTDPYKGDAYAAFRLVTASNRDVPVTTGKVYIAKADVSTVDAQNYILACGEFDYGYRLLRLLQNHSVEEVQAYTGCELDLLEALAKLDKLEDMKEILTNQAKPYFDAWLNDAFYSRVASVDKDVGKVVVPIPRNSKISVYYVDENGVTKAAYDLTVGSDFVAGTYTMAIK